MIKFLSYCILTFFAYLIVFKFIPEQVDVRAVGQAIIGLAVFLAVLAGIYAINQRRKYFARPATGPMKVNVWTEDISKRKKRLHFDVVLSRSDVDALEKSGIKGNMLFTCPTPHGPEPFRLGWLVGKSKHHRDFDNIEDLDQAKAQLIEQLHIIRTRLDEQKDHTRTQARTGASTQTKLEI
jgi:hypothetical protein